MTFEVQLPGHEGAAVRPPPPSYGLPLPPDESHAMINEAAAAAVLTTEQAAVLRSIQAALHDYDELGWFIERSCREFREYSKDREQKVWRALLLLGIRYAHNAPPPCASAQLDWGVLHQEYIALVEAKVHTCGAQSSKVLSTH